MSISGHWRILFLATATIATIFVGCGKTVIDDVKTEASIEQNIEDTLGKKVTSVDCPSDVEVEKGETFGCTVSLVGGKEETATIKILNEDADIELADLQSAK